jgi:hypothetical protein
VAVVQVRQVRLAVVLDYTVTEATVYRHQLLVHQLHVLVVVVQGDTVARHCQLQLLVVVLVGELVVQEMFCRLQGQVKLEVAVAVLEILDRLEQMVALEL